MKLIEKRIDVSRDDLEEQLLRERVLLSEKERLKSAKAISISEVRKGLRERMLKSDKFF